MSAELRRRMAEAITAHATVSSSLPHCDPHCAHSLLVFAGLDHWDPDPLYVADLIVEEPVLRPGFLRRLVAAVAAWWRG